MREAKREGARAFRGVQLQWREIHGRTLVILPSASHLPTAGQSVRLSGQELRACCLRYKG